MAYEWIVEALASTWGSIERLVRPLPESEYGRATPCPGWTVRDVISHLSGFEKMIHDGGIPRFEGEYPDYVRNPIGEINEAFVAVNRSKLGSEVLDEFVTVTEDSVVALRQLSDEDWERVGWSPEGEKPFHRFQETRVLDSWIHLQDIRDALLQPEDDHGPGEEIVVNRFESALPFIMAKKMRVSEGCVIRLNLTGRLARSVTLQSSGGRIEVVASLEGEPDLEVTTPVALFWRRCAGRISDQAFLSASATDIRGTQPLAEAFAEALAIMI